MSTAVAAPHFPFPAADPLDPPPHYAELQQRQPVAQVILPSGDPAWLITRYQDVRRVLADRRFSRAAITAPGAPRLLAIAQDSKSIFVMDPPEHTRLRRLVSHAFGPQQIGALLPRVRQLTGSLLDAMAAAERPAEVVSALARPLPITVICEMLGVPHDDVGQFRAWTDVMLSFAANPADEVLRARAQLSDYLTGLIAAKREEPTDDLLMTLITAREEGDALSEEELLAFGYTLLGAGYHATTGQIVHGLLRLLRQPAVLADLRERPEQVPVLVDELMRLSQAGGGIGALRIAVEDVEVAGVKICTGDAVLPSINAANRDASVFARPDQIDLTRPPAQHLAFGHGTHYCIGATLGRAELEIAITGLITRFSGLQLAIAEEELQWNTGVAFRVPATVPVTWSSATGSR